MPSLALSEGALMLVLARRSNETIVLGETIRITLLDAPGKQIRLGIEAPRELRVSREEITPNGSTSALAREPSRPAVLRSGVGAGEEVYERVSLVGSRGRNSAVGHVCVGHPQTAT
jgi:carbon storage regulator